MLEIIERRHKLFADS